MRRALDCRDRQELVETILPAWLPLVPHKIGGSKTIDVRGLVHRVASEIHGVRMATPEQIPTDLTLEIGADLSPDRFIATARAFFGYVQEISQTFAPESDLVGWTVKVREGSTLLAVDPSPSVPPPIAQIFFVCTEQGIRRLADGNIEDSGLPEGAIRHLKTLADLAEGTPGKNAPVPLRLWIKRKPIPLEPD
jgi:hypothetical protein